MSRKHTIRGWNADYKYESEKLESGEVLVFELSSMGEWKFRCRCYDMESALNMIEYMQGRNDTKYICAKIPKFDVIIGKVEKTEISEEEIAKRQAEMWK